MDDVVAFLVAPAVTVPVAVVAAATLSASVDTALFAPAAVAGEAEAADFGIK